MAGALTPRFLWTVIAVLVVAPVAAGAATVIAADPDGRHAAAYGMGVMAVGFAFGAGARVVGRTITSRSAVLAVAGGFGGVALALAVVTLAML